MRATGDETGDDDGDAATGSGDVGDGGGGDDDGDGDEGETRGGDDRGGGSWGGPSTPADAWGLGGGGKRDRIAGFATLLPPHAASCASPPPAKRPALAPGCVEHGQASARAKPAHTRHPWGLAKRKNHRRWR